jgi:hypothetical protein
MLAIMLGSALFRAAMSAGVAVTRLLKWTLSAAALALGLAFCTFSPSILYLLFVVFETCCGLYYPAIATLRGELLPESFRAGIMVGIVGLCSYTFW